MNSLGVEEILQELDALGNNVRQMRSTIDDLLIQTVQLRALVSLWSKANDRNLDESLEMMADEREVLETLLEQVREQADDELRIASERMEIHVEDLVKSVPLEQAPLNPNQESVVDNTQDLTEDLFRALHASQSEPGSRNKTEEGVDIQEELRTDIDRTLARKKKSSNPSGLRATVKLPSASEDADFISPTPFPYEEEAVRAIAPQVQTSDGVDKDLGKEEDLINVLSTNESMNQGDSEGEDEHQLRMLDGISVDTNDPAPIPQKSGGGLEDILAGYLKEQE